MREDRARLLQRSSFSKDLDIYSELDEIAGTSGTASYPREVVLQFLRNKGWVIEELAAAVDNNEPEQSLSQPQPSTSLTPGPQMHAISSSE